MQHIMKQDGPSTCQYDLYPRSEPFTLALHNISFLSFQNVITAVVRCDTVLEKHVTNTVFTIPHGCSFTAPHFSYFHPAYFHHAAPLLNHSSFLRSYFSTFNFTPAVHMPSNHLQSFSSYIKPTWDNELDNTFDNFTDTWQSTLRFSAYFPHVSGILLLFIVLLFLCGLGLYFRSRFCPTSSMSLTLPPSSPLRSRPSDSAPRFFPRHSTAIYSNATSYQRPPLPSSS